VADVVTLPRPTRTAADAELALPPCRNAWGPLECPHAGRRPGPHVCWTWTGWPHICRCLRCLVGTDG
jgi:hypothetical protein